MKKLLLLAALLISSLSSFSQSFKETVYLKNGSVVKGNIVEFQPDKSVKMEDSNGSVFTFEYDDIDKIILGRLDADNQKGNSNFSDNNSSAENAVRRNRHYRGFVSGGFLLGDMVGVRLSTTHGEQLNSKIFLGAGIGMCMAEDWDDDHFSIPIYADFRVDFLEKKISPFLEIKAGSDFAVKGISGFYGDLSVGCRFKRSSVSFGAETFNGEYEHFYDYIKEPYYNDGQISYTQSFVVESKRLFNFVTRFSFEF